MKGGVEGEEKVEELTSEEVIHLVGGRMMSRTCKAVQYGISLKLDRETVVGILRALSTGRLKVRRL